MVLGEFILLKNFDYDKIVVLCAGLTVILCAVYLLRMYGKAMFGTGDERILGTLKDISGVEFTVLASLAGICNSAWYFPKQHHRNGRIVR